MNSKIALHLNLDTSKFEQAMKQATAALASFGGISMGLDISKDDGVDTLNKEAMEKVMDHFKSVAHEKPMLYTPKPPWPGDVHAHNHTPDEYWYKWGSSPSDYSVGGIDEYAEMPQIKIPVAPGVVIDPTLNGNMVVIRIEITILEDFLLKFKGCTGDAAKSLTMATEKEVLKQLIALNKELHEEGA